ncbi:MAG: hypothetical protein JXA25_10210 [Anaerolineales bacterium]|nr:hypothetical protein [Anaerolineales bacterium]
MSLQIIMEPESAGQLVLGNEYYHPGIAYKPGDSVLIKIVPESPYQFTGWTGDVSDDHMADVPLKLAITEENQVITANFKKNPEHSKELVFDSAFENGNGILRYYDRDSRRLVVEPQQINLANNIWWHFKIHNITPGEFLHLDIDNWEIAGDCQPVFSYDGKNWQRMTGVKSPYIQRFEAASVEIARNIPYTFSHSLALVDELVSPYVQPQILAISEGGRQVKTMRITDPQVADDQKRIIWVMARLHAFESHSSILAEGLARWLTTDNDEARAILKRFIVYITPIMDVDNVVLGGSGKEQLTWDRQRVDFNRQWGDTSHWAAVRAAKQLLEELQKTHDIAAFIDLHDPWFSGDGHWDPPAKFETQIREFSQTFIKILEQSVTNARWKFEIIVWKGKGQGIEPTLDPTLQTSTSYASSRLFPEAEGHLCFVMEIPHWTDGYGNPITIRGLSAYGEALGRALGDYLNG